MSRGGGGRGPHGESQHAAIVGDVLVGCFQSHRELLSCRREVESSMTAAQMGHLARAFFG